METLVEFVSRPNRFSRDTEAVARDKEVVARDEKLLEGKGSNVESTESSLPRDLLKDTMQAVHYLL